MFTYLAKVLIRRSIAAAATNGTDKLAGATSLFVSTVVILILLIQTPRKTWNFWDWRGSMVSVCFKVKVRIYSILDNHHISQVRLFCLSGRPSLSRA